MQDQTKIEDFKDEDYSNIEVINGIECDGFALLIKKNDKFYIGAMQNGIIKVPSKKNMLLSFAPVLQFLIDEPGAGIRDVLNEISLYAIHSPKKYEEIKSLLIDNDNRILTNFTYDPYFDLEGVEAKEEAYKFKALNIGEDLIAEADLAKQEKKQTVEN